MLECPEAVEALETGDAAEVDLAAGEVRSPKGTFRFFPMPEAVRGLIEAGGLIEYTKRKLGTAG